MIYLDGGVESGAGGKGGDGEGGVIDNTNYMVAVIILAIVEGFAIIAATLLYFMRATEKKKYDEVTPATDSSKKYEA